MYVVKLEFERSKYLDEHPSRSPERAVACSCGRFRLLVIVDCVHKKDHPIFVLVGCYFVATRRSLYHLALDANRELLSATAVFTFSVICILHCSARIALSERVLLPHCLNCCFQSYPSARCYFLVELKNRFVNEDKRREHDVIGCRCGERKRNKRRVQTS
jgi:hypothetical protein